MPAPHHSVFYRPDALPAAQPTASKQCLQGSTVGWRRSVAGRPGKLLYIEPGYYWDGWQSSGGYTILVCM